MDKHIPIPAAGNKRGHVKDKHGFRTMEIGDSFFTTTLQSTLTGTSTYYAKLLGTQYTTRKTTEAGVHGVRVWRIK